MQADKQIRIREGRNDDVMIKARCDNKDYRKKS